MDSLSFIAATLLFTSIILFQITTWSLAIAFDAYDHPITALINLIKIFVNGFQMGQLYL